MNFTDASARLRIGKRMRRECWDVPVHMGADNALRFELPPGTGLKPDYTPTAADMAATDWIVHDWQYQRTGTLR